MHISSCAGWHISNMLTLLYHTCWVLLYHFFSGDCRWLLLYAYLRTHYELHVYVHVWVWALFGAQLCSPCCIKYSNVVLPCHSFELRSTGPYLPPFSHLNNNNFSMSWHGLLLIYNNLLMCMDAVKHLVQYWWSLLPSSAWAEGTVLSLYVCVCVSVCVLPQNCCKLRLSWNLNKLQVTNETKSGSLQNRQVLAGKRCLSGI